MWTANLSNSLYVSLMTIIAATNITGSACGQCDPEQIAKLLAPDGAQNDGLGVSVSVSGDAAVIGAPHDDDQGSESGSAHIFRYDGANWIHEAKLMASDGAEFDEFGASVAISGDIGVFGAPGNDVLAPQDGAAYVFDLPDCHGDPTAPEDITGDGVVDMLDLIAVLAAWGWI